MTTLEAQKLRLEQEMREALEQINIIKKQPCPDFKILNYYTDVVVRDQQLIEMIDYHLFGAEQSRVAH
ncbi:MAG: hypothetical protein H7A01_11305 [Hahellaceae bacterium]|jgi:hypothetical protein|nr:hypothetical protein [Hahellaceae bacterium]MCP5210097.1 hypothetical protein [Hahellaceae bacterium]